MKRNIEYCLVIAALLYCIWNARALIQVWSTGYYFEQSSWMIFLIWLLPLFYFLYRYKIVEINQITLGSAVILSFIGNITSLYLINYVGLALALSSFLPISWMYILWFLGSILWMPQFSWILSHLALNAAPWYFSIRLLVDSAITFAFILKLKNRAAYE